MDIYPVFNKFKAVKYMCQYFSKTEDQCSQAMKLGERHASSSSSLTMETIAKAYLRNS